MSKARGNEVVFSGGAEDFVRFLGECCRNGGLRLTCRKSAAEVVGDGGPRAARLLMPAYDKGGTQIPEMDYQFVEKCAEMRLRGERLYIENYSASDYAAGWVFGHMADSGGRCFHNEYLLVDDRLKDMFPDGCLLQARNSFYVPSRIMGADCEVLLHATDCVGVNEVFKRGTFSHPVLARSSGFWSSAMSLTNFDKFSMLPHSRWRKLYVLIFSDLLQIPERKVSLAFERVWPAMRIRGLVSPTPRNIRKAVSSAVKWHFDSGLLLDRSGRNGMFEMIRSRDLKVRRNVRTDATLLTGLLLTSAGTRFKNGEWLETGRGLVDGMLRGGVQLEGGWTDGFFRWYMDLGLCPTVWSSDTSRAGLAVINMFKLTGDPRYLESSMRLGGALLRWFGGNELINGTFATGTDIREIQKKENLTDNPVYYGEMTSFLLQLHKLTGDERYRDLVMRYFERISTVFPATKPFGFSDNFTYSRYLMMLVVIHAMGGVDVLPEIRRTLAFFRRTQDASGGFRETPIRLVDHAEAGVGIGDGSDNIADLLYCNNFLLCALSTLRLSTDRRAARLAEAAHERLLRFVLSAQIAEPEKSLCGGWMRAFDMDGGEYHGLNKDKDWGAYCIMAGWMTGLMPLALLEILGGPPVFVVRD